MDYILLQYWELLNLHPIMEKERLLKQVQLNNMKILVRKNELLTFVNKHVKGPAFGLFGKQIQCVKIEFSIG